MAGSRGSVQYRLDLRPCARFLVKMSVFRVRTCSAKVYESLYNISFRDNVDISDIYCCLHIPRAHVFHTSVYSLSTSFPCIYMRYSTVFY